MGGKLKTCYLSGQLLTAKSNNVEIARKRIDDVMSEKLLMAVFGITYFDDVLTQEFVTEKRGMLPPEDTRTALLALGQCGIHYMNALLLLEVIYRLVKTGWAVKEATDLVSDAACIGTGNA